MLVSVYLSPNGLGHQCYDLGVVATQAGPFFRLGRFLTGLYTLSTVPWESIKVFVEVDEVWIEQQDQIHRAVRVLLPNADVHGWRLRKRAEWSRVANDYSDSDVVYLHANDDHALVHRSPEEFMKVCEQMQVNKDIALGAVTHFPEMVGLLQRARQRPATKTLAKQRLVNVEGVWGTTLVRGEHFKTWWKPDTFDDDEIVVRPDNPLGKSVSFLPATMLVPRTELVRHLDGYSHVDVRYPYGALRNLIDFQQDHDYPLRHNLEWWNDELWPKAIFADSPQGADLLTTLPPSERRKSLTESLRLGVARIQHACALRIAVRELGSCIDYPTQLPKSIRVPALLLSILSSPQMLRNALDLILDAPTLVLAAGIRRLGLRPRWFDLVFQLGTTRAFRRVRR